MEIGKKILIDWENGVTRDFQFGLSGLMEFTASWLVLVVIWGKGFGVDVGSLICLAIVTLLLAWATTCTMSNNKRRQRICGLLIDVFPRGRLNKLSLFSLALIASSGLLLFLSCYSLVVFKSARAAPIYFRLGSAAIVIMTMWPIIDLATRIWVSLRLGFPVNCIQLRENGLYFREELHGWNSILEIVLDEEVQTKTNIRVDIKGNRHLFLKVDERFLSKFRELWSRQGNNKKKVSSTVN